ncbi:MAG: hypothetical protein KA408_01335 [Flavobacteriales bacterium]|nr:hypothetical protein [Flavobacteriales bacterium]
MSRSASIGIEVPCRKRAVATVQVTVTLNEVFLCYCEPRAGRLVPPRALAKALRRILLQEETKVRTQLTALPKGQQSRADELVKAFKSWKKHVEDNYLTPHYLRLLPTEQFQAFALPNALRCQLLRQCYPEPLALLPQAKKPRTKKPQPPTEQPLASAAHLTACHVRLVSFGPLRRAYVSWIKWPYTSANRTTAPVPDATGLLPPAIGGPYPMNIYTLRSAMGQ